MRAMDDLEEIEAEVRRLMAKHARIAPRGWASQRERNAIQSCIDTLLDNYRIAAEVAEAMADPELAS